MSLDGCEKIRMNLKTYTTFQFAIYLEDKTPLQVYVIYGSYKTDSAVRCL